MNLNNIIKLAEETKLETFEQQSSRRDLIKSFGTKILAASLPLAVSSLFNKAKAQNLSAIIDTLNFALQFEYLEAAFYSKAIDTSGLIPNEARSAFEKIRNDESNHVNLLKYVINELGGIPGDSPTFDFTGNGAFNNVFNNYETFLALSQMFEDTGIRMYKTVIVNVKPQHTAIYHAINIHSVEGRHASYIRSVRGVNIKPWIPGNTTNITQPASIPSYAGEENATQAGIPITGINGFGISFEAATEAFDEPLERQAVLNILNSFIIP